MNVRLRSIILFSVMITAFAGVSAAGDSYPQFSYDLGAASGISNVGAFVEIQAGLNTHFLTWLTWRNSGFYRIQSESDDFFGLDTSLLAGHRFSVGERSSLRPQAGVGYRFTSIAEHAPFAEAGIVFHSGSFTVGANLKYLFYDLVDQPRGNELIYGINASGRMRGTF